MSHESAIMAPTCETTDTPPAKTSGPTINGSVADKAYMEEFRKKVPSWQPGSKDGGKRFVPGTFRLQVDAVDSRVPPLREIGDVTLTSELDAFFKGRIVWKQKELGAVVSEVHNQSQHNGGMTGWNVLDFAKIASISIFKVKIFIFH